jgi:hypothetical protein
MMTTIDKVLGQSPFQASAPHEREKERRTPDELWTLAVAHTLVEQLPRLSLPELPTASGAAVLLADGDDGPLAEQTAGGLGHSDGVGKTGSSDARAVPAELHAELSDERLGRLGLHVSRAEGGLDIVINVADSRVKALIETERAMLLKTLKDAGLRRFGPDRKPVSSWHCSCCGSEWS